MGRGTCLNSLLVWALDDFGTLRERDILLQNRREKLEL